MFGISAELQGVVAGVAEIGDRVEQSAVKIEYDELFHRLFFLIIDKFSH